jgi:hypothetical protein
MHVFFGTGCDFGDVGWLALRWCILLLAFSCVSLSHFPIRQKCARVEVQVTTGQWESRSLSMAHRLVSFRTHVILVWFGDVWFGDAWFGLAMFGLI